MQAKRVVLLLGIALAVVGVGWWLVFYGGAADRLMITRMDFYGEVLPCLVYTTDTCRGIGALAGFFGFSVYKPIILWVAIACLVVGVVAPSGARRRPE